MIRNISVFLRRLQGIKSDRRLLETFTSWKSLLNAVPETNGEAAKRKLLIIRLDDIGDYLLFRNFLPAYKKSQNWIGYEITYLGNLAVEPLFNMLDAEWVDKAKWIDKKLYFKDEEYRKGIWQWLADEKFEVVVNPSRTRQLLLDDMCMLATSAPVKLGAENTFETPEINYVSNQYYKKLFKDIPTLHEFFYNQDFASWCSGVDIALKRPEIIVINAESPAKDPYILMCIGAAHKSKRWSAVKWIELIRLLKRNKMPAAIISGGIGETEMAKEIANVSNAENITGATTLPEMITWMSNAKAAVCNDSMAAHLAVSCNIPLVMLSNGNKYYRFTAYRDTGIEKVITVYALPFLNKWKSKKPSPHRQYIPVTKDMATISPEEVFKALQQLLHQNP